MAEKYKRHLKKEIDAGKAELPDELQFLSKFNYFAVAEQRVRGTREWCIEIQAASLNTLLDTKKKLNAARLSNRQLAAEIQRLEDEEFSHGQGLIAARAANTRLKESIEKSAATAVEDEQMEKKAEESAKDERIRLLERQVSDLQSELVQLEKNHQTIIANIGGGNRQDRPDKYQRSPKNIWTSVEESGQKLVGLPLQGGAAGSVKK